MQIGSIFKTVVENCRSGNVCQHRRVPRCDHSPKHPSQSTRRNRPTRRLDANGLQPCRAASDRGCVKTLTKIFGPKIDLIERPTSDHRHCGNGFGTPNFYACPLNVKFSHRLGTFRAATNCFFTTLSWSTGKPTKVKTRNVSSGANRSSPKLPAKIESQQWRKA